MMKNNKIGIYIHIPFCIRKCSYCDFLSFQSDEGVKERYIEALCREIEITGRELNRKGLSADTVFIGGGTPTVLSCGQLETLLQSVNRAFPKEQITEFTVEANPGTVDRSKAEILRAGGVNRISMGVQSMNEELLRRLGRIHTKEEAAASFAVLREAGFDNINTDIMFALPGQSLQDWKDTVEEVLKLGPEHISFYSLIIEEGTPFFRMLEEGKISVTDDELDRSMYHYAVERLKTAGYHHYEISNAALPGRESVHNIKYWSMEDYLGLGLGSSSYYEGIRYTNPADMEGYLKLFGKEEADTGVTVCDGAKDPGDPNADVSFLEGRECLHENSFADTAEEFMFTGLRLVDGIRKADFRETLGKDIREVFGKQLDKMTEEGLLTDTGDRIRLTEKGLDLANYVMREFVGEI